MSVRPFLNIEKNISETYPKISITLQNKGIGPALIIDQKITYNGISVNNWSSLTELIEKDKLIFWKKYVPEWYDLNHLTVSSKDEYDVYTIANSNLRNLNNAIEAFNKITIDYTYTDIYQDTFKYSYPK
ncbi:MAG: hypothetical protein IPP72_16270 [Chitinophagaceae bacterium]|nr:hypothetical protein [Chitinophagaceae bacterium]